MSQGTHRSVPHARNFSIVWTGQTVSLFGDYVAYLTVPLFLAELSQRAFDFGLLSAAENLPTLIFGFVGATLLDRYRLRWLIAINELARAAAFFSLAILVRDGTFTTWGLFAFAFVAGSLAASFNASLQAFIPSVAAGLGLSRANGRLSLSQQIAFLLGPLTGGLIVKVADFSAAFAFNGVTFLVSALSFIYLSRVPQRALGTGDHFMENLREGWAHLWGERRIRLTTLGGGLANFITGFIEATLVLIGAQLLGTDDPARLGIFFVGMGAGGIIGAISAPRVIDRVHIGRTYVFGFAIFGFGMFGLTWSSNLLVVTSVLAVGFAGLVWTNVSLLTMRQLYTPQHLLGRVSAAGRGLAWSTVPFGALFGTALADRIGLLTIVRLGPILIVLFAVYLSRTVVWSARNVAEYDQPA
ncbi:MAG: MFS transporter [Gammaproteobacteria bacterium]|nr:MFS transporter [Gammaproteobacteria bacterium]